MINNNILHTYAVKFIIYRNFKYFNKHIQRLIPDCTIDKKFNKL